MVTSKAPDTLSPVVLIVVAERRGSVEVPAEVEVIFPDVRKSPDKLRDDPFNPVAVIGPANEEVPVVVTSNDPERVNEVAAISVDESDGIVDVAEEVTVNLP